MLQRALSKAKKEGGKKVPINFQVPSSLKEEFDNLCKKNEVSITSMLTALMETAIEEAQGVYFELNPDTLLSLNNRLSTLDKVINEIEVDNLEQETEEIERLYHSYLEERSRLKKIFNAYKGDKK